MSKKSMDYIYLVKINVIKYELDINELNEKI